MALPQRVRPAASATGPAPRCASRRDTARRVSTIEDDTGEDGRSWRGSSSSPCATSAHDAGDAAPALVRMARHRFIRPRRRLRRGALRLAGCIAGSWLVPDEVLLFRASVILQRLPIHFSRDCRAIRGRGYLPGASRQYGPLVATPLLTRCAASCGRRYASEFARRRRFRRPRAGAGWSPCAAVAARHCAGGSQVSRRRGRVRWMCAGRAGTPCGTEPSCVSV